MLVCRKNEIMIINECIACFPAILRVHCELSANMEMPGLPIRGMPWRPLSLPYIRLALELFSRLSPVTDLRHVCLLFLQHRWRYHLVGVKAARHTMARVRGIGLFCLRLEVALGLLSATRFSHHPRGDTYPEVRQPMTLPPASTPDFLRMNACA